jgi:hypothetical protein
MMILRNALLLCVPVFLAAQSIPETDFRVRLLGPISTETSRRGDQITAQVLSPAEFQGAIMEGVIKESKSGKKVKVTSVLNFTFETLVHNDKRTPVQSSVKTMVNSQGEEDVDEEGRVIRRKNNLGKAAVATGAGALLGGILGGAKGAAIGAGVGAAASLVLIQVAAEGANVRFDAGSEFILEVKERSR